MIRAVITLIFALGTINAAWAQRILEQVETPFELALSDVTLPTAATGSLTFKVCEPCRTLRRQVANTTQYFVNGTQLPFADFLLAVDDVRKKTARDEPVFVGVFVDNQSERVSRIMVLAR